MRQGQIHSNLITMLISKPCWIAVEECNCLVSKESFPKKSLSGFSWKSWFNGNYLLLSAMGYAFQAGCRGLFYSSHLARLRSSVQQTLAAMEEELTSPEGAFFFSFEDPIDFTKGATPLICSYGVALKAIAHYNPDLLVGLDEQMNKLISLSHSRVMALTDEERTNHFFSDTYRLTNNRNRLFISDGEMIRHLNRAS